MIKLDLNSILKISIPVSTDLKTLTIIGLAPKQINQQLQQHGSSAGAMLWPQTVAFVLLKELVFDLE